VRRIVVALTMALVLAGCSSSSSTTDTSGANPSTADLIARAHLPVCPATSAAGQPGGLPDLTLDCLGAGPAVTLSALRGPALVNGWASWCGPCQKEVPVLSRIAALARGRLQVLGVASDDTRRDALDAAPVLGVHYPSLIDPSGHLRAAYGLSGLPFTLFVDASGKVVHVQPGILSSTAATAALIKQYLGLRLGAG
jgi:cytochrome c biogenesis protein CcmG, thiol:disulfide interchange protein DsbE